MILLTKDVIGYEGLYTISVNGDVKSVKTGKILARSYAARGYHTVSLNKKGQKPKAMRLHRLIAMHFIPNPNGLPMINHIDGDKLNNSIDNLEWCDASHNVKHSFRVLGQMPSCLGKKGGLHPKAKKVVGVNKSGDKKAFDSVTEAAIYFGVTRPAISLALIGKAATACGHVWSYQP